MSEEPKKDLWMPFEKAKATDEVMKKFDRLATGFGTKEDHEWYDKVKKQAGRRNLQNMGPEFVRQYPLTIDEVFKPVKD